MKKRLLSLASALGLLLVVPLVMAAEKEDKIDLKDVKCPVSGAPAKAVGTADYLGKTVFFCCKNCPKAFAKDPKKFATKANHQLAQTKQIVQVACPISGAKLNPETAIKVAGVSVSFCCENCQAKAKKASTDDQLKMLFAKLDKAYTLQTKCPISGRPIDVSNAVSYKDQKVYFCCEGCPAAFESDPEKYVAKLPQLKKI